MNFVLKTDEGETESIDFCSLVVLVASVDEDGRLEQKVSFRAS